MKGKWQLAMTGFNEGTWGYVAIALSAIMVGTAILAATRRSRSVRR